MFSPANSDAAKEAPHPLLPPPSPSAALSAIWMGIQTIALSPFRRKPANSVETARGEPDSQMTVPPNADSTPSFVASYTRSFDSVWRNRNWSDVENLIATLRRCWSENRQVFLCGNGGSAANAIHLANDLLYGVAKEDGRGLRVTALPSNAAVLTCLANDISYEDIFSQQLTVLAQPGDVLIAFSGSGNSPNIVRVLERAREIGVTSFAILGFTGGKALGLADHPIYFPVHDMQVSEDLQMMVGHMTMQELAKSGRHARKQSR